MFLMFLLDNIPFTVLLPIHPHGRGVHRSDRRLEQQSRKWMRSRCLPQKCFVVVYKMLQDLFSSASSHAGGEGTATAVIVENKANS